MYESEDPASFIQITGPAADIDEISDYMFPAGARRCDLHGRCWIEMPSITDDQAAWAMRCDVAALTGGLPSVPSAVTAT